MKKASRDLKTLDMSLSITELMLLTRACVLGKMYLTAEERAGVNKIFAGLTTQLNRLGLEKKIVGKVTKPMNLEEFND